MESSLLIPPVTLVVARLLLSGSDRRQGNRGALGSLTTTRGAVPTAEDRVPFCATAAPLDAGGTSQTAPGCTAAGVLGGMSAIFGPPMIAYLVGRGTDPDSFVKQLAIFSFAGRVGREHSRRVEVLSLYWHFVDAVWVIVFTVVYVLGR